MIILVLIHRPYYRKCKCTTPELDFTERKIWGTLSCIKQILRKFGGSSTTSSNPIAFLQRGHLKALVYAPQNGKFNNCPTILSRVIISSWNLVKMCILLTKTFGLLNFGKNRYFGQNICFSLNFGTFV